MALRAVAQDEQDDFLLVDPTHYPGLYCDENFCIVAGSGLVRWRHGPYQQEEFLPTVLVVHFPDGLSPEVVLSVSTTGHGLVVAGSRVCTEIPGPLVAACIKVLLDMTRPPDA